MYVFGFRTFIYVCIYIYIYIVSQLYQRYVYINMCMRMYLYIYIYTCVCVHICIWSCTRMCAYIRTLHTYTQIREGKVMGMHNWLQLYREEKQGNLELSSLMRSCCCYIYIYIYVYAHTHTHTHSCSSTVKKNKVTSNSLLLGFTHSWNVLPFGPFFSEWWKKGHLQLLVFLKIFLSFYNFNVFIFHSFFSEQKSEMQTAFLALFCCFYFGKKREIWTTRGTSSRSRGVHQAEAEGYIKPKQRGTSSRSRGVHQAEAEGYIKPKQRGTSSRSRGVHQAEAEGAFMSVINCHWCW
jgi:hypothetical protein